MVGGSFCFKGGHKALGSVHAVDGKGGDHGDLSPTLFAKIPDKEDPVFLPAGVAIVPVVVVEQQISAVIVVFMLGHVTLHKAGFRAIQPGVLQTGPVARSLNVAVQLNRSIGSPVQMTVHIEFVSHLQGGPASDLHQQFAGFLPLILGHLLIVNGRIVGVKVIHPQGSTSLQHQFGVVAEFHRLQIQLRPGAVHGQREGICHIKTVGDDPYHLQSAVGSKAAHVVAQCMVGHTLGKIDQAGPVILVRNQIQGGYAEVDAGNIILLLTPFRPLEQLQDNIVLQRQVGVVAGKVQHRIHTEDAVHFFGQVACGEGDVVVQTDGAHAALGCQDQALCIIDIRDNIGHMVGHCGDLLIPVGPGIILGAHGEAKTHHIPHSRVVGKVLVEDHLPHLVAHILDVVPVLALISPPVDDLEGGVACQIDVEFVGPVAVLTVEEPCTVSAQVILKAALWIPEETQLGQAVCQGHGPGEGFSVAVYGNIGAELVHLHLTIVGICFQNGHLCLIAAVGRPNHGRISIGDGGIIIIPRFFIPDGGEEGQIVFSVRRGVGMMLVIAGKLPGFAFRIPIDPFCSQMGPVTLKFQLTQPNCCLAGPLTAALDVALIGH